MSGIAPIDPSIRSQVNSLDREGLSQAAISEILGIPPVDVQRALGRGPQATREDREVRAHSLEPELTERDRSALDRLLDELSRGSKFPLSLGLLLKRWSDFVTEVEQGYKGRGEDYANNLATRDILSMVSDVVEHSTADKLADALTPWDERLKQTTLELPKPIRVPRQFRSRHLPPPWWYWRVPQVLANKEACSQDSDAHS